jgi:hypothetical protein
MVEDGEWWFNVWIVKRNEMKEDECGWQRLQSGGSACGLREVMRRRKWNLDGTGCRVVVQHLDCEKE